jgi:RND family efflux transporter MFP subunit
MLLIQLKSIALSDYRRLLVGVLLMVFAGIGNAQQGPAPVVVVRAQQVLLAPTIAVPGTVISRNDSKIASEVTGRITWIAEVGTVVIEGDPIARLDDTFFRLQKSEFAGQVERQRARLTYLEPEVERLKKLREQNIAAISLLDQTRSDLEVARGDTRVAEARLAQAGVRLARTTIRAPFAGVVTERMSNIGEMVNTGSEVVRLVDPSAIEIVARAPLRSAAFLKKDAVVQVSTNLRSEDSTVRTIVPFGDPRSHMFEMRLNVDPANWVVGESVQIAVPTAEAREVLAVPRDALVLRRNGASVFRVGNDQLVERVSILAGSGDGDMIEVSGDLKVGDKIVIRGAERLRPGQKVMVLNTDTEAGNKTSTAN